MRMIHRQKCTSTVDRAKCAHCIVSVTQLALSKFCWLIDFIYFVPNYRDLYCDKN